MEDRPTCPIVEDGLTCGLAIRRRGMCSKHYTRWCRHGDPLRGRQPRAKKPVEERFYAKVDKNGPVPEHAQHLGQCWVWTGATDSGGYGLFRTGGLGTPRPHIWAYTFYVGPVPDGLELDHLCRNRACANPDHLEPVTRRENVLRSMGLAAINARKTHCPQGHEYTPENTYYQKSGGRQCRTCIRDYNQRKARKNSAKAA